MPKGSKGEQFEQMIRTIPPPYTAVHFCTRYPGFFLKSHAHQFFQIIVMISGKLTISVPGGEFSLRGDAVCFLPPNIPHELRSEDGYTQVGVDMMPEDETRGILRMLREYARQPFFIAHAGAAEMATAIEALCLSGSQFAFVRTAGNLDDLISQCLESQTNPAIERFVAEFNAFLNENMHRRLRLVDIAEALHISPSHLERSCARYFGCGVMVQLTRMRIQRACVLLNSTSAPIAEIAHSLGFYDSAHFSNLFKQRVGETPSAYRRSRNGL